MRYTQRGTPPSSGGPPFTIEAHIADAVAVLDAFEVDRAWAIGHSWGAHLALHLLVARPERLLGVVTVDPLGAFREVFADSDPQRRARLSQAEVARVEEIEARRREGEATEADLLERFALIWPGYFVDPQRALPPPRRIGVEASIGTNRSIAEHFDRSTLRTRLPEARLPALFVCGEESALPVRWAAATAALIPGAELVSVPGAGHFPWVERPGCVRAAVAAFLAL